MTSIELYYFKIHNPATGKSWRTQQRMTLLEAAERYGEGSYQALDWTRVVRDSADRKGLPVMAWQSKLRLIPASSAKGIPGRTRPR